MEAEGAAVVVEVVAAVQGAVPPPWVDHQEALRWAGVAEGARRVVLPEGVDPWAVAAPAAVLPESVAPHAAAVVGEDRSIRDAACNRVAGRPGEAVEVSVPLRLRKCDLRACRQLRRIPVQGMSCEARVRRWNREFAREFPPRAILAMEYVSALKPLAERRGDHSRQDRKIRRISARLSVPIFSDRRDSDAPGSLRGMWCAGRARKWSHEFAPKGPV